MSNNCEYYDVSTLPMQLASVYTCPYDAYYVLYVNAKNVGTTAYFSLRDVSSDIAPVSDVPLIFGTQMATGDLQAFYFKAGTKIYAKYSTGTYYLESIFKCNIE